jgi:DNA-binding NtrC family response regulator
MSGKILIIEDEETLRESLKRVLLKEGYEVAAVESAEAALPLIAKPQCCDVIVSDIILPGVSGMEFLKSCRQKNPDLIVIIMTAYATIESAVEAIRAGAYEYIVKPVQHEALKAIIKKALSARADRRE